MTSPNRPDSDWDGVVDSAEDSDGDRLSDRGEQRFGTDPSKKDSDGDGTPDGAEDKDRDGRSNAREQDQRPVPAGLRPSLAKAPYDKSRLTRGCAPAHGTSRLVRCKFGASGSSTRIVLVGDSHATMLTDPIARAAKSEGWRLVTMLKGGCIPILATMNRDQYRADRGRSCRAWRRKVIDAIKANPPDLVILTASESYVLVDDRGRIIPARLRPAQWRKGIERMIAQMPPATEFLVLGDVPDNDEHPVRCLKANRQDMSRCLTRRLPLSKRKVEKAQRAAVAAYDAQFDTLYHKICSYDPCPLVQGTALMWRDKSHLSASFARRLTPSLRKLVAEALAGGTASRRRP